MTDNTPNLPRVVRANVDALADAWGLTGKPERSFLWRLGQSAGALRIVSTVLNLAASTAEGAGAALSLEHLQGAWARLGGQDA
jgi:hypothetical protein